MMVYGLFILVTQSNNANGWCLGFYVSYKSFSVLVFNTFFKSVVLLLYSIKLKCTVHTYVCIKYCR